MSGKSGPGCFFTLLTGLVLVDAWITAYAARDSVKQLEQRLTPITSNVIAGPEPDTWYHISPAKRVFIAIDGVPVEEYLQRLNPAAPCGETVYKPTAKGTFEYFVPCADTPFAKKQR